MGQSIAVDLDGTLRDERTGQAVPLMLERVRKWLAAGVAVKIFTARACRPELIPPIHAWLKEYGLPRLTVTCTKDLEMLEFWDDRSVQVEKNTGRRMDGLED